MGSAAAQGINNFDFTPESVTANPPYPAVGDSVQFGITLRNNTNHGVRNTRVQMWVNGQMLGTQNIDRIPAGATWPANRFPTWYANRAGKFPVRVRVTADDGSSREVTATATIADQGGGGGNSNIWDLRFEPDDVTANPAQPNAGDNVQFGLRVHNGGSQSVNNIPARLFVAGRYIGSTNLNRVYPGQTATISGFPGWRAPNNGQFNVRIVLGEGSWQREVQATATIGGGGGGGGGGVQDVWRLSIDPNEIQANPRQPNAGQNVRFAATIRNNSGVNVTNVSAQLYIADKYIGAQSIGTIRSDNFFYVGGMPTWQAPRPGNYQVRFVITSGTTSRSVIANAVIGDGGGGGGGGIGSLSFGPNDITPSPPRPVSGQNVNFSLRIRNSGGQDVNNVTVTLYVAGRRIGTQNIDRISAGGNVTAARFPMWNGTQGQYDVRFVVAVNGREADVRATATIAP